MPINPWPTRRTSGVAIPRRSPTLQDITYTNLTRLVNTGATSGYAGNRGYFESFSAQNAAAQLQRGFRPQRRPEPVSDIPPRPDFYGDIEAYNKLVRARERIGIKQLIKQGSSDVFNMYKSEDIFLIEAQEYFVNPRITKTRICIVIDGVMYTRRLRTSHLRSLLRGLAEQQGWRYEVEEEDRDYSGDGIRRVLYYRFANTGSVDDTELIKSFRINDAPESADIEAMTRLEYVPF